MAKRGPKPKITPEVEREILACLTVGASLNDAADYVEIHRANLNRRMANDPKFAKGVDRAIAKGKLHHLNKVGKAEPWQSSAWMLERKWGSEWGRKDQVTSDGTIRVIVEYVDNNTPKIAPAARFAETSN